MPYPFYTMKKSVVVALLLGILLILPIIPAQTDGEEETEFEVYSGFNRFIDNFRMLFTFGEGKVQLALEIREKEVNSAIANRKNGNDEEAERNLERARERLQFVQTKVSKDMAENVIANVNETVNNIIEEVNLSDSFETYILEEKKTGLTAELVIEFEGKEGQTLTREIVRNESTGRNEVEITVDGDNGEKVWEIEGEIGEIDGQIAEHVIATDVAGGSGGDDGLSPEVETYTAGDGTQDSDVATDGDGGYAEGTIAGSPGDTVIDPDGPDSYAEGTTAEGENTLAP